MASNMDLKTFIKSAKENTFAAGADPVESSRNGSTDFVYEEGKYTYRDSFLGDLSDVGEELVWFEDEPVWGMNYRGGMIEGHEDKANEVFEFLKEALSNVPVDYPYRGPKCWKNGNMVYVNHVDGNVTDFVGKERIYQGGEMIYERKYHGGRIK